MDERISSTPKHINTHRLEHRVCGFLYNGLPGKASAKNSSVRIQYQRQSDMSDEDFRKRIAKPERDLNGRTVVGRRSFSCRTSVPGSPRTTFSRSLDLATNSRRFRICPSYVGVPPSRTPLWPLAELCRRRRNENGVCRVDTHALLSP